MALMIRTRLVTSEDRLAVQELLGQLGYDFSAEDVQARLNLLAASGTDPVLVATRHDEVVGLIALQFSAMLHLREPVARITALVVRDGGRGGGIGRALIDAGDFLARQAGCSVLELTTAVTRTEAHVFYRKLGFINSSLRFSRAIQEAVVP
ncbi:GNAT family N-acetyltransferase [Rhodopseudomonas sp. P2A-2r]|uniref:GNAT family N-acetyltransferase n=1 Tax=unclassified Rhodopseudomonas TaxID=2638247 RepID=UPI002234E65E|nr:GNAT family N-acetyltransferase [Rhodopseudomonas sp. P2A-2r]UZE46752.1 GNAT family N-acetyltransferase [Rhodopseudomonas sp. P2A-2r]